MRNVIKHDTVRGVKVVVWINLFLIFGLLTIYQEAFAAGLDKTLRLFFWQAPTMLNPHLTSGFKDMNAARLTYEPLASFDAEGNLIPFLAAEIPSLENGGVVSEGEHYENTQNYSFLHDTIDVFSINTDSRCPTQRDFASRPETTAETGTTARG